VATLTERGDVNPGPERWTELARRFDLGQVHGAAEFVARGAMGEVWRLETMPLSFLFVMTEQAIAEPGHRDYCDRQLSGLLHHDLDDLARFLDLAEDLLHTDRRSGGSWRRILRP
jgi:hypothetical protein